MHGRVGSRGGAQMLRPQAAVSVQLWALALGVLAAFLFGVRSLALPALQHVTLLIYTLLVCTLYRYTSKSVPSN